ncbi:hypothetical protein H8D36_00615 [archaeon]|nr:hypothetical protein [archaeon]MBL7057098.1 hypothetical protein [Candidatus Woesearchaeota archaeon]
MALTDRMTKTLLGGLAAVLLTVGNPNFEAKDIVNPYNAMTKPTPHGIMRDRIAYKATYAATAAFGLGALYLTVTGNARRRRED